MALPPAKSDGTAQGVGGLFPFDASEFFWACACTSEGWQKQFGSQQPRCGVCLAVARFYRKSKEQQALQVKKLLANQFMLSSWVATNIDPETRTVVRIPRDIAEKAAGWESIRYPANAAGAPPQTTPEAK
jgi:hypothetical protein